MIAAVLENLSVETDARFLRLIGINAPLITMQRITGVSSPAVMRRQIDRVCLENGLTYNPEGGRGKFVSRYSEVALADTYSFRFNLFNWLAAYREYFPEMTKTQLIDATGLSSRALDRVRVRPHDHDWTLTELHRFATSLGMQFATLLVDCTTRLKTNLPRVDPLVVMNPCNLGF